MLSIIRMMAVYLNTYNDRKYENKMQSTGLQGRINHVANVSIETGLYPQILGVYLEI